MSDGPLLDAETLRRLERLSLVQLGAVLSGLAGTHAGPSSARGGEFTDHRPYAPGDDLRRIDWNAYARLRQPVVRLAEDEAPVGLALHVDASASMAGASLAAARRVAALLGAVALLHADVTQVVALVGGTAHGGERMARAQELWTLTGELERIEPAGATDLAGSVRAWLARGLPAQTAVLVTDALVEPGAFAAAIDALLAGTRAAAVVQVLDDAEGRAVAEAGTLEAVDRETGERVIVTGGADAAARHRRRVEAHVARVGAACGARGVGHAVLGSDEDPMDLLARLADARVLTATR